MLQNMYQEKYESCTFLKISKVNFGLYCLNTIDLRMKLPRLHKIPFSAILRFNEP